MPLTQERPADPANYLPVVLPARVEILVVSDPDDSSEPCVRVWLDGVEVTASAVTETVDPRDSTGEDAWQEETDSMRCTATHTPDFNDAVIAARDSYLGSDYLDG